MQGLGWCLGRTHNTILRITRGISSAWQPLLVDPGVENYEDFTMSDIFISLTRPIPLIIQIYLNIWDLEFIK